MSRSITNQNRQVLRDEDAIIAHVRRYDPSNAALDALALGVDRSSVIATMVADPITFTNQLSGAKVRIQKQKTDSARLRNIMEATRVVSASAAGSISTDDLRQRIRYSGVVYDGGIIRQPFGQIVVAIDGVTVEPAGRQPSLYNHKSEAPVGHHQAVIDRQAGELRVIDGVISLDNQYSQEVVSGVASQHPWQASIRGRFAMLKAYKVGQSVTVNGRQFDGPILVAYKFVWHETSWTGLGAAASQPRFEIEVL